MNSYLFADDLPVLDINRVIRQIGATPYKPTSVALTDLPGQQLGSVTVAGAHDWVSVSYQVADQARRARVGVERTPCHLGGSRPWWRCPRCGRRAALLVFDERAAPGCRGCLQRPYSVQHAGDLEAMALRVARARRWLGPGGRRPRGMRWPTYRRLLARLAAAEADMCAALAPLRDRCREAREVVK